MARKRNPGKSKDGTATGKKGKAAKGNQGGKPETIYRRGLKLNRRRTLRTWDTEFQKVSDNDIEVCDAGHEWQRDDLNRTCPYCYRAIVRGVDPREIVAPRLSGSGERVSDPMESTVDVRVKMEIPHSSHRTAPMQRIEVPDRFDIGPREKLVIRVERPDARVEATATKSTERLVTRPEPKKPDPVERMHRNAVAAHLRSGKTIRVTCKDKALDMQALRGEITRLLERQGGRCARTGVEFDQDDYWLHASLDRVVSSKGYIPGNLQVVTWFYNRLKGTMDEEEFLELAYLHFGGHR
ncbi:hypothetical protein GBZ26_05125 [Azospirillum formosense]|uniref:Uncharacterized protein n=1 Tax=Azospirillum formosense TaxID=861533 RepID=A0ABX2KSI9_9PROT|nr:hypothetical protein [Azospirillum formosense]MBY3753893.1 hypothetical protein [Azospirillum formosense]NUB18603.1 hypothetical protein [Azospirillum formosense]